MTQEELTAWISAGAAIVQAIGAIAAIWFSISLARASERRSIEAERASVAREVAAEAASITRADAAERRSEARERAAREGALQREEASQLQESQALFRLKQARQEQAIRSIEIQAKKVGERVEQGIGQFAGSLNNTQFNGDVTGFVIPFLAFLDSFESTTKEVELLEKIQSVRVVAVRFRDEQVPNPAPADKYVASYRRLAQNIVDAAKALRKTSSSKTV